MNCFFCKEEIRKKDIEDGEAVTLRKDGEDIVACASHHGVLEEKERQEGPQDA